MTGKAATVIGEVQPRSGPSSGVGHGVAVHEDDEITSDELDDLVDEAQTLAVGRISGPTEMRLYVTVDAETLHELEQRAAKKGLGVAEAVSDALRASARAA